MKEQKHPFTESIEEFTAYLMFHGIPVEKYGKDDAKTIGHLFEEVRDGVSRLEIVDRKLTREVRTIVILVTHYLGKGKTLRLVEDRQEFTDGRVRYRDKHLQGFSLSEKLNPSESEREAVARTLKEELKIENDMRGTERVGIINRDRESQSYPGLITRYINHSWNYRMPKKYFRPEGYVEVQKDKKTYWVWEEVV